MKMGCLSVRPSINNARKGNERVEAWLMRLLVSNAQFGFLVVEGDGNRIVVPEVHTAVNVPVRCEYGVEYPSGIGHQALG